jgi:hypothetical protein
VECELSDLIGDRSNSEYQFYKQLWKQIIYELDTYNSNCLHLRMDSIIPKQVKTTTRGISLNIVFNVWNCTFEILHKMVKLTGIIEETEMLQGLAWKADSYSGGQEMPCSYRSQRLCLLCWTLSKTENETMNAADLGIAPLINQIVTWAHNFELTSWHAGIIQRVSFQLWLEGRAIEAISITTRRRQNYITLFKL